MNAAKSEPRNKSFLSRPASELMTPSVVSISENASVSEAMAMLIDRGFSGAPVVNDAGRPVGVVSQSDVLIHDRNTVVRAQRAPDFYMHADITAAVGEPVSGFQIESVDRATVADVMTPVVFSVSPEAPARQVIEDMLRLRVHRLFVVGGDGVLVGVISMSDVVRHLLD
jgi:CBS domain-containing protein